MCDPRRSLTTNYRIVRSPRAHMLAREGFNHEAKRLTFHQFERAMNIRFGATDDDNGVALKAHERE